MYSPKFYVGFLSYKLYNYIAYIAEIILRRITVTPKNTGKTFINIFLIITIIFYGYFLLKVTLFKGGLYGMEATGIRSLNLDPLESGISTEGKWALLAFLIRVSISAKGSFIDMEIILKFRLGSVLDSLWKRGSPARLDHACNFSLRGQLPKAQSAPSK